MTLTESGTAAAAGADGGAGEAQDPAGSAPRASRITTLVPLLVAAAFPFVVVYMRVRVGGLRDPDSFWHILGGQHFARTREVVFDDPYGHFSSNAWVQLDWLSDLLIAAAYSVGGLAGAAWMYTAAAILVFPALLHLCRQRSSLLAAVLVAVVAWIGTSASLGERSQVFSFILLAVTLAAWHRTSLDGRARWWLVPLTWVWAALHGFWFTGPLVGVVALVGLALGRQRPLRELGRLALVPVLSGVAACLTPLGPKILTTPLTVNSYAQYVSEYAAPDIHNPAVAATVVLLAVTALGWASGRARPSWSDALMWVVALGWALLYSRTVALGAVIVAPLAAAQIQGLINKPREPVARLEKVVVATSVGLAIATAALLAPSLTSAAAGKPTALDEQLRGLPAQTVVLNDDGLGGWLLLTHPELRPVADTRTYLFSHDYIEDYIKARSAGPGWQEFVRTTGAKAALLREKESLPGALVDQLGWRQVAAADGFVLLVAP